jgi:hypothetical protein
MKSDDVRKRLDAALTRLVRDDAYLFAKNLGERFLSNGNFRLSYRSSSSGDLVCAVKVSKRISTPTRTTKQNCATLGVHPTGFGTISEQ